MPGNPVPLTHLPGLSETDIPSLQEKYGRNIFQFKKEFRFLHIIWDIAREPMFILLAVACTLYFILGNISEGLMMAFAIVVVAAISVYQEVKSTRALKTLEHFTEPAVTVIRDGKEKTINVAELVPGDIVMLSEGMKIPADIIILQANDLAVNESAITGESFPVEKNETEGKDQLFQGTTINSGKCIGKIAATGNNTVLGKIGKSIAGHSAPKTILQVQINKLVRNLASFGIAAFLLILAVNYYHYNEFVTSLLFALTLAMSAVPEEIPVAFSSFMALGAYKMSRLGIISRQPQIIENLGTMNVLCLDKTGTITENRMAVKWIYDHTSGTLAEPEQLDRPSSRVLIYGTLASESNPFDPMEKAIWEAYMHKHGEEHLHPTAMIAEYPLEGQPPMMTHVYHKHNEAIAAGKGAAERIIRNCKLEHVDEQKITGMVRDLASKGYRVLAVSSAVHTIAKLPENQDDFAWKFEGLLALYDPPKQNIAEVFRTIYKAGVDIKLLTGDHPETAINIARQTGIHSSSIYLTGEAIMNMPEAVLQESVKTTNIFARMFPDAKLKVIKALQANGNVVAMTGDGINDGPALKASDIGIAMGEKGTETARQSADLILTDDNLERIVIAVREGRKIYTNLVKAIRYIISIHIPIILTASLPLLLNWKYPNIFTPIHVIFLELIMGPTCSIFFEREPVEESIMLAKPRRYSDGLFTKDELLVSIIQGLLISGGVLLLYYGFMYTGHSLEITRTIVFTTLIIANILLTFANRSFTRTIYYTFRFKNPLVPLMFIVSVIFLSLLHFVPGVQRLFGLAPVGTGEFLLSFAVAFASVMWFEVYKMNLSNRSRF